VLTDAYLAKRMAAKGEWVPYELFGQSFKPFSALTWAIPIVLLAIGGALLPLARRITARAWLAATRDVRDEALAPSVTTEPEAVSQGARP
jgi:cytochrome c-type biogenesis protein CcmH/NrfF